jgi:hypothetical protein
MESSERGMRWRMLLLVGLSLSIGWGIRGNYGHQYGAMLPGALAAMAAVLLSEREDWLRRIPFFALFGAIGWAFGGSMSYMVVIAYTHSGHAPSVLYGFACLFVIGFLWGAIGGAGTALPAYLSRERLIEFFAPLVSMCLSWWAFEVISGHIIAANPAYQGGDPLDWYDTDWTAALLTVVVLLLRGAVRRRFSAAERLILCMAVGWWLGFLILTIGLHLRMTPPRGDNWAGSIGMVLAMLLYFHRHNLRGLVFASLVTGFVGGLGFSCATLFKLIELKSGLDTNWHSVLEQTYGLINGLGVALLMILLRTRAPRLADDATPNRVPEALAVGYVILFLTYINLYQDVGDWTARHGNWSAMPSVMVFLSANGWFDLFYALTALAFLRLLRAHMRRPLPLVPATWLGKGQMLYLMFLWWIVIGNLFKAIVAFAPQRLITEGTIYVNALLCTLMALLWAQPSRDVEIAPKTDYAPLIRRALTLGGVVMILAIVTQWGIVRALWGDRFSGYAGLHIRFGPHNTNNKK